MKPALVCLLIAAAKVYSTSPLEGYGSKDLPPGAVSYHETIGFPTTDMIREAERRIFDVPEGYGPFSIGGTVSTPKEHPYLVGLIVEFFETDQESSCTAALVRPNRVFTASHCWFDGLWQADYLTAVFGSQFLFHGGTRIETKSVISHPDFDTNMLSNDIAIVNLPYNVNFSPISLPSASLLSESFVGMWGTAAGYGLTSYDLEHTDIKPKAYITQITAQIITNDECKLASFGKYVRESHLCSSGAGGIDTCFGDSGGPFFVTINGEKILVGLTSFGTSDSCGLGEPSVFTRVTSFYDWYTPLLS